MSVWGQRAGYLGEERAWGLWSSTGYEVANGQDTLCQISSVSFVLSRPLSPSCCHQDTRCLFRTPELVFLLSFSTTGHWWTTSGGFSKAGIAGTHCPREGLTSEEESDTECSLETHPFCCPVIFDPRKVLREGRVTPVLWRSWSSQLR